MCATANIKTMLLDFFMCVSNYQFTKNKNMFLCTGVYKISKFVHNTYTKILSDYKSENVCVYEICKYTGTTSRYYFQLAG